MAGASVISETRVAPKLLWKERDWRYTARYPAWQPTDVPRITTISTFVAALYIFTKLRAIFNSACCPWSVKRYFCLRNSVVETYILDDTFRQLNIGENKNDSLFLNSGNHELRPIYSTLNKKKTTFLYLLPLSWKNYAPVMIPCSPNKISIKKIPNKTPRFFIRNSAILNIYIFGDGQLVNYDLVQTIVQHESERVARKSPQ